MVLICSAEEVFGVFSSFALQELELSGLSCTVRSGSRCCFSVSSCLCGAGAAGGGGDASRAFCGDAAPGCDDEPGLLLGADCCGAGLGLASGGGCTGGAGAGAAGAAGAAVSLAAKV